MNVYIYALFVCSNVHIYMCVFYSVDVCMEQQRCSVVHFFETPCILIIVLVIVNAIVASITVVVS